MIRILTVLAALVALPALIASPTLAQQGPIGRWLTQDGRGVVAIEPCGAVLCGAVVGVTGFQPNGAPPVDYQGRSRCKLQIIGDLHVDEPGIWAGHIMNPDDGNVYTIHISLDPQGRLLMRGFIGIPLLGRTTVWTRYQGRLTTDCHLEHG